MKVVKINEKEFENEFESIAENQRTVGRLKSLQNRYRNFIANYTVLDDFSLVKMKEEDTNTVAKLFYTLLIPVNPFHHVITARAKQKDAQELLTFLSKEPIHNFNDSSNLRLYLEHLSVYQQQLRPSPMLAFAYKLAKSPFGMLIPRYIRKKITNSYENLTNLNEKIRQHKIDTIVENIKTLPIEKLSFSKYHFAMLKFPNVKGGYPSYDVETANKITNALFERLNTENSDNVTKAEVLYSFISTVKYKGSKINNVSLKVKLFDYISKRFNEIRENLKTGVDLEEAKKYKSELEILKKASNVAGAQEVSSILGRQIEKLSEVIDKVEKSQEIETVNDNPREAMQEVTDKTAKTNKKKSKSISIS
jgi:hypothetical protein